MIGYRNRESAPGKAVAGLFTISSQWGTAQITEGEVFKASSIGPKVSLGLCRPSGTACSGRGGGVAIGDMGGD